MKILFTLFSLLFILNLSSAQQVLDNSKILGVTIDDPFTNISEIASSLTSLCYKPTTRIVFDEFVAANEYTNSISQIKPVSFIMGELLDSFYVKDYTVNQYLDRTTEYLDTFENQVDIWEIGNEVNGEWLGNNVIQKIEGAFDIVKARNKKTALTLYYNRDCYNNSQNEMFTWVQNLPNSMKQNLDYVLVSYYEDDCNDVILSETEWQNIFDNLHQIFPNSKLGIGECGTTKNASKVEYMNRYYQLNITTPNYIGGYFWWYYKQDCVPKTKALWNTINTISCQWASTLDVLDFSLPQTIVYPNPVSENITIDAFESIEKIKIFDALGKQIRLITGNQKVIPIKDLPKGILFMQLFFNNNKIKIIKVIHQ